MKIELEATKEEAMAFMRIYSVGLAVMTDRLDLAVERANLIRADELSQSAGSMMRKLCMAIDAKAATAAGAAESIHFRRN